MTVQTFSLVLMVVSMAYLVYSMFAFHFFMKRNTEVRDARIKALDFMYAEVSRDGDYDLFNRRHALFDSVSYDMMLKGKKPAEEYLKEIYEIKSMRGVQVKENK